MVQLCRKDSLVEASCAKVMHLRQVIFLLMAATVSSSDGADTSSLKKWDLCPLLEFG